MRFLIFAPDYRHTSGGVDTLHRLCHWLNRCGYQAGMSCGIVNPEWFTPPHAPTTDDTVAIYPEIVHGNPFGVQRIIRWVLNNPGKIGGPLRYDDSEFVFYWPWFKIGAQSATSQMLTDDHELIASFINPNIYYKDDLVLKTKYCYFPAGPVEHLPLREERDYTLIQNLTNEELGQLLRETKTFYCFREDCAIISEALMCGAEVVYIDPNGKQIPWDENISQHLPYINYEKWTKEFWLNQWENTNNIHKFVEMVKNRWGDF